MKKSLSIILLLMFVATVTGCGTIRGVGEDIRGVGNWLTKGSDNVREGLAK